jgi:hypothetical protein
MHFKFSDCLFFEENLKTNDVDYLRFNLPSSSPFSVYRRWKRTMWTEMEHCPIRNSWQDANEARPSSRLFLAGSRRGETVPYLDCSCGETILGAHGGAETMRDRPLDCSWGETILGAHGWAETMRNPSSRKFWAWRRCKETEFHGGRRREETVF